MKTLLLTLGAAIGLTVAQAHALTDADSDGRFTREEIRAAFPGVTDEAIANADSNGDGLIDMTELKSAQASGLLPAQG